MATWCLWSYRVRTVLLFVVAIPLTCIYFVFSWVTFGLCLGFQTDEFLGRKLAKRLKKANNRHAGEGSAASGIIGEHRGADGDDGNAVVEVLGRERRKEADALDLEVIDDRDLYQHLLKVGGMVEY